MSRYCRLCSLLYKVNSKGKIADAPLKLFKVRDNGVSHAARLSNLGIFIEETEEKSTTICKKCINYVFFEKKRTWLHLP